MAIEKKKNFMEDETTAQIRKLEDETNWAIYKDQAIEVFKKRQEQEKNERPEAKSWEEAARTRGCIKCLGHLMIYGESDTGYMMVKCRSCGYVMFLNDITPFSNDVLAEREKEAQAVSPELKARYYADELYREIPNSVVNQYTERRKRWKEQQKALGQG